MSTVVFRGAILLVAVTFVGMSASHADEIEDAVTDLFQNKAGSLVLVEFDLERIDGRGGQEVKLQGTVVSEDGLVLVTSAKRVDPPVGGSFAKPEKILVRFPGDVKRRARFIGKDEELNLALLELEPEEDAEPLTSVAAFTANATIRPGQQLLALKRLPHVDDDLATFAMLRVATVIPRPGIPTEYRVLGNLRGETGCPVYQLDGQLVGFVAAGTQSGRRSGRGFQVVNGRLVPMGGGGGTGSGSPTRILHASDVQAFLADPTKYARRDCWLGVKNLQALTKPLAEAYGIDEPGGIVVGAVSVGSPADRAGLAAGDVLVALDGERIEVAKDRDIASFEKKIRRGKAEAVLTFKALRSGDEGMRETSIRAVLEEAPLAENEVPEYHDKKFGLKLKPLTRDFLERSRLDVELVGVRVTGVDSASWASIAGIRSGDVIRKMVLKPCENLDQYRQIMADLLETKDSEVCYNVIRERKSLFLCVRPNWDAVAEED